MDEPDWIDIAAARTGDAAAYERLVRRYETNIARQLWRFTRNRNVHEELVQDVFVEAYFSLHSFAGRRPILHWLSRIATRVGYRYWKLRHREQKRKEEALETVPDREMSNAQEAGELLHALLAKLKPPERLILTLMYLEELSVAEVADRTGWNRAVVKMRSMRARRRLKEVAGDVIPGGFDA